MYILSFSPCSHPPGSPQHLGAHNGETSPRVSGFLVFALVLGSFTALLTTGLYLKTLQEKRAEQVSLIIMTTDITGHCPGPGQVSAAGGGGAE